MSEGISDVIMESFDYLQYRLVEYLTNEFDELKEYWLSLESGKDMTAFQSFNWYRNINSLYLAERVKNCFRICRYIVVFNRDIPIMIAPIEIRPLGIGYKRYGAPRGIFFIGRMGYTDYLNFIYKDFNENAVICVIDHLHKKYKRLPFMLERLPESSESYRFLTNKYSCQQAPVSCAALFFPESFEEYKMSLSKNTRQNIRTAINRANKNGKNLTHEFIIDENSDIKEKIISLNKERINKKAARSRKEMSLPGRVYCFFADLFRKAFSAKPDVVRDSLNTFCFLVKNGDRIISFYWGIRNDYRKEFYVILVGVDKDYEWYSPNISHLYLFIEECYNTENDTIKILDFTRGAEGYKKTIGCQSRPVSDIIFRADGH